MDQLGTFIIHHWELWLALLVVVVLIFINERFSQHSRSKNLSPSAAVDLINHQSAVIADIRDKESFRTGHIIDAISVTPDDFSLPRMEKYKTKPIILVCAKGLQSNSLASKLKQQGYSEIYLLTGGIAAWQAASLPLTKSNARAKA